MTQRKLAGIMGIRDAATLSHRALVARLRRSREDAYWGYSLRL